jgi:hypothetical protein
MDQEWRKSPNRIGKNMLKHEQEIVFIQQDIVEHNVFSVVVSPGVRASDGVIISESAIKKAAHGFMKNYQEIHYRHSGLAAANVIESTILIQDTKLGTGEIVRKGSWWLGVHVQDTDIWNEIEQGDIKGFSLGGYITSWNENENENENVSVEDIDIADSANGAEIRE